MFFIWYICSLDDASPYIQVDFREAKYLSGIVTQGEGREDKWVTGFQVFYSFDGEIFSPYSEKQDGGARVFKANNDSGSSVTNYFVQNIMARYIRIVPVTSHNGIALR